MTDIDWRLPENRREAFMRFYTFHLKYRSHPGLVYQLLPVMAEALDMDADQRAWLVWLNGNTQNAVSSLLLLRAAPTHHEWREAVDYWNSNFRALEWDTDRRHQKSRFGEATEKWAGSWSGATPAAGWLSAAEGGWEATWKYAVGQPYMGRLSAWSMTEYARILLGPQIPDASSFLMEDQNGSRSHRNGAALVMGEDSVHWPAELPALLGTVDQIDAYAEGLLAEAHVRNAGQDWAGDVTRLTLESAFCTFKSWFKPNRRYPNVYSDMMYNRIRKAEARFPGEDFGILWEARARYLPPYLRLEDTPSDPGFTPEKMNHFLETGQPIMMHREYPDMANDFNDRVDQGLFSPRKDPQWELK